MHLIFRTLLLLARSRRRPRLSLWQTSSLPLKALPTDIDIAMIINNGMYFSLMDLGRFDLMVRAGFWDVMSKRKWTPVVQSEQISFRKSIRLWQSFSIETKIIGLDEKCIWIEQRFVREGEIYARGYLATRFVDANGAVALEDIVEAVRTELGEVPPEDFTVPEWLHEWRGDVALPGSRKPAPHRW
ncbi:acyl-CoA thioesterase [Citricoccus alkalitolerans]|uniref:Acyl-CoA thioesterase n=1 Tax=Citricoccus alkalitolerans TaxID=246603 RepID=A0ABV8XW61_9MICC